MIEHMISLQKNFLFIHIPKTGGNSLSSALLRWSEDELMTSLWHQDGVERFDINNPGYGTRKHSILAAYRAALPEDIYAGLFKFSVMRNPWERLVSLYFSPHRVVTLQVSEWKRADFLALIGSGERAVQPLRHFITSIPPSPEGATALDSELDFLLRYENLDADFAELCDRLSLPRVALPVHNRSERKPYTHYYDAELREIVRQRFAEEIAFGGYEFGA